MEQMNSILRKAYLDYTNNYLTLERFAEHNALDFEDAAVVVGMGEKYHERHVKPATIGMTTENMVDAIVAKELDLAEKNGDWRAALGTFYKDQMGEDS
jgi:hypothetical protein